MACDNVEIGMSLMPYWLKFFTDAGIPAGEATNYAVIFTDHRIQQSMLCDLTKEYLNDMGFSVMGDIIAILKHARTVSGGPGLRSRTPIMEKPSHLASRRQRTTAASRLVNHYTGFDPDARPLNEPAPYLSQPDELSARFSSANKSSVFDRLGDSSCSRGSAVSPNDRAQRAALRNRRTVASPVVNGGGSNLASRVLHKLGLAVAKDSDTDSTLSRRLSLKRPAAPTDADQGDRDSAGGSPLPYAGVLKLTPTKKPKTSHNESLKTLAVTVSTDTAGVLSPTANINKKSVRQRLGNKRQPVTDSNTELS